MATKESGCKGSPPAPPPRYFVLTDTSTAHRQGSPSSLVGRRGSASSIVDVSCEEGCCWGHITTTFLVLRQDLGVLMPLVTQ
mmetsp:Transcript_68774/g.178619  ORF Transcript_68774/g.178619 Transcript_68774/m.178619 type:complete len:82 (+) Transcript_68774:2404-2649(+)